MLRIPASPSAALRGGVGGARILVSSCLAPVGLRVRLWLHLPPAARGFVGVWPVFGGSLGMVSVSHWPPLPDPRRGGGAVDDSLRPLFPPSILTGWVGAPRVSQAILAYLHTWGAGWVLISFVGGEHLLPPTSFPARPHLRLAVGSAALLPALRGRVVQLRCLSLPCGLRLGHALPYACPFFSSLRPFR